VFKKNIDNSSKKGVISSFAQIVLFGGNPKRAKEADMHNLLVLGDVSIWLATSRDRKVREIFHRLRYEVYVKEKGWEQPNKSQMERDCLDEYSDFILAIKKNRIIGGCRLINGRKAILPIANHVAMEGVQENAVEISRFINLGMRYKIRDIAVDIAIFKAIKIYTQRRKYECVYMVMRKGFIRTIRCVPFLEVGPRFIMKNKWFVPTKTSLSWANAL
jgi:N-acyl-L-homoserine lactone synthetase